MCANSIDGLGANKQPATANLDAEKQYLTSKGVDISGMDEAAIRTKAQELRQNEAPKGSVFTAREGGAKGPSVTVTDNENHEITFDNYTSDTKFQRYLARKGFTDEQIDDILAEKDPAKVQAKLKAGLDADGEKNKSGTLVLVSYKNMTLPTIA